MKRFFSISPLILQTIIWLPTRFLLGVFARFEVHGLQNLEQIRDAKNSNGGKRGIIFASNHGSELDPVLLPAALPFLSPFMPIFYTSRERSFYNDSGVKQIFYGGLLFKLWGSHAVHAGLKDYEKSLVSHIALLEQGKSVLIFPEGGIPGRGSISGKAHGGVAFLSVHTGCPIVPVHIIGAEHLRIRDFFLRRHRIGVTFGAPIFVGDAVDRATDAVPVPQSIATYKEIAESVMEKVKKL